MNTEITKYPDSKVSRGWVFYDAACTLCVRGRQRAGRLFASRGFMWVPLQTPATAERLGVGESAFDFRMHLLTVDGRVLHNADALGALCRSVWWLWPLGFLLLLPGFREVARAIYDWFARNRYFIGGACRVNRKPRNRVGFLDWTVAVFLPVFAGFAFCSQPPWLLMWALAFAMGFPLKWLTWRDALALGACPSAKRASAWFLLWPGLDGRAFLGNGRPVRRPEHREWVWSCAMTVLGAVLIWVVVPPLLTGQPMTAAWVGMVGIAFLVHFGVIRLLSNLFRYYGMNAEPIMDAPFRATSLSDLWGARWNTAFSIPAKRLVLLPLARRIGTTGAGFIVFLISGLLHDVVISLPAREGFGLPTLYFVLQGAGVAIERSHTGRSFGLGEGLKGWLFVILFALGPLYWLFHPAFAHRVIVPFLSILNGP